MADRPKGFVVAAPHSGSGKTLVTLGLCRALVVRGVRVAPAKTGPDYIDPTFLSRAAKTPCINLDPWAMNTTQLRAEASQHAADTDMLVVEGVMGLFDGSAAGAGSTADLAAALNLPVVLVVDSSHMAQSIAAMVSGYAHFRSDVHVAGAILNKVASERHENMLRSALKETSLPVVGVVRRNDVLKVPGRHLGLTLPDELDGVDAMIAAAAQDVTAAIDFDALQNLATPVQGATLGKSMPPLGQNIAIARDASSAFVYEHFLRNWQQQGASIRFFSPLADEAPDVAADAVFLPGGYPELYGAQLAAAQKFKQGMLAAKVRGALIYGECGGYMMLGQTLTDKHGMTHEMSGLLPVQSRIDRPRRQLGYRQLRHRSALPWAGELKGHEFHYASSAPTNLPPLFNAKDALGANVPDMGAVDGRVMGSYAHVICEAG